jgi:hypothetical protein
VFGVHNRAALRLYVHHLVYLWRIWALFQDCSQPTPWRDGVLTCTTADAPSIRPNWLEAGPNDCIGMKNARRRIPRFLHVLSRCPPCSEAFTGPYPPRTPFMFALPLSSTVVLPKRSAHRAHGGDAACLANLVEALEDEFDLGRIRQSRVVLRSEFLASRHCLGRCAPPRFLFQRTLKKASPCACQLLLQPWIKSLRP